jgi:hypothetical protein
VGALNRPAGVTVTQAKVTGTVIIPVLPMAFGNMAAAFPVDRYQALISPRSTRLPWVLELAGDSFLNHYALRGSDVFGLTCASQTQSFN